MTLVTCACASSTPAAPHVAPATSGRWPELVSTFIETYLAAHPSSAVMLGRHEFDGQLPDFSRAGIAHVIADLERTRERAAAFSDAELSVDQRFEREYVLSRIDKRAVLVA